MKYREFGKTGKKISALGMGCMRLPMEGEHVDKEKAVALIRRAIELGINYFDTGKIYCNGESEETLGEAVKGYDRSKVFLSTKYAMDTPTEADLLEKFEESLKKMDQEYIDFYHFWGIGWEGFKNDLSKKNGPLDGVLKLKEQGLIKHLAFSFHSAPEDLPKIIDTGYFETLLCQYNILDRKNAEGMEYAHKKGMGVAIMGPVGGGRLGGISKNIGHMINRDKLVSSPETALRFVLGNPSVTMALSGVSTIEQLEENVKTASLETYITPEETKNIEAAIEENKSYADLYCTGCNYCLPCPQNVLIPKIFELVNYHRVYKLEEAAYNGYKEITEGSPWIHGKNAEACIMCGKCEKKCPQKIKIMEQLKEAHAFLSSR